MTPPSTEIPWGEGSTATGDNTTYVQHRLCFHFSPKPKGSSRLQEDYRTACLNSFYAIFMGKAGWGALASLGGRRESDHSSQMNTNKMEHLARWRYILSANRLELTIQTTFACQHSVIYIRHFHDNTLGHSTVGGVLEAPPRLPGYSSSNSWAPQACLLGFAC